MAAEEEDALLNRAHDLLTREGVTPEEAEAVREECRRAGNLPAEAAALRALCVAYFEQWRLEECLAAAREAQTLFERTDDVVGQALALTTIVDVRLATGWGHDVARKAAQKARKLFQQAGPDYQWNAAKVAVLECQAQVCVLLERPVHVHTAVAWAEALKATQEVEDLARGLGDLGLAASALCVTSQVHTANKRHQAALRAARAAADLYHNSGGPEDVAKALLLAAEAAVGAGKKKDAHQFADQAKEMAKEAGNGALEAEAARTLEGMGQDLLEDLAGSKQDLKQSSEQDADASTQASTLKDTMYQVMALDLLSGTRHSTPLIRPGPPAPFRPLGHKQFLSLGQNQQANAILDLMKRTDAETVGLRPMAPHADLAEPAGKLGAAGVAWVAPVRKRMEKGAQSRLPIAWQGVSLERLPQRVH